jgi:hypothetical protein
MSFLEKWNASIIWLRDLMLTPLRTTWDRARQWPVASIIGIIAVLFAFYFYKTPILEFIDHADVGKIVVNSPTVYTRQRLVNDRLDQAHWLRTQLKSTEVGYDQKFNSIDQVRRTVSNTQFKIADAPAETSTDASARNLQTRPQADLVERRQLKRSASKAQQWRYSGPRMLIARKFDPKSRKRSLTIAMTLTAIQSFG